MEGSGKLVDHDFKQEMVERLARIEEAVKPVPGFLKELLLLTEKNARFDERLKVANNRILDLEKTNVDEKIRSHNKEFEKRLYKNISMIFVGFQLAFWFFSQIGGKQ